jgi:hypothetical protein
MVVIAHLGEIECLASLFELESASFEKVDPNTLVRQTHGENESRNATPDETDCRVERIAGRKVFQVDMHTANIGARSAGQKQIPCD